MSESAVADVSWITITSGMSAKESGDDSVSFTVAANAGADARVGTITVRDKVADDYPSRKVRRAGTIV